jgi:hypothetical protein
MKFLKIIVFAVGSYYILRFLVRLYNTRKKMHVDATAGKKEPTYTPPKKPMINPNAGEYTDYEEVKD